MSERRTEVRTYRIDLICDECGGRMAPTGQALMSYPVQYPHKCEKCGAGITVRGNQYPCLIYDDVPK